MISAFERGILSFASIYRPNPRNAIFSPVGIRYKLNILVLINSLNPGGGEASATMMANAISTRPGMSVDFAAQPGPMESRLNTTIKFHPLSGGLPGSTLTRSLSIRKVVGSIQPDLIHVHGARLAVQTHYATRFAHRSPPLVMTHHSRGFGRIPGWLAGWLLRASCTHLIAVSHEMEAELSSVTGWPERISVIPHPLDIDWINDGIAHIDRQAQRHSFGVPDSAVVVSIAARLVQGKGLHTFIDTVGRFAESTAGPVVGVIAGEGPLVEDLKQQAMAAGLRETIKFVGYQPDIRPLLSITDIVLFPSAEEMLPVFLLESSAAGVPIVCSDLPGNRDVVIDGVNGLVVGDTGDYTEAVAGLLDEPGRRQAMGAAGSQMTAARFSSEKVGSDLTALYDRLVLASR